jgi:hypothetical protein
MIRREFIPFPSSAEIRFAGCRNIAPVEQRQRLKPELGRRNGFHMNVRYRSRNAMEMF